MTAIKKYILKPISNDLITKRENSVTTTYNSAKHWNTCMANKPCKIIAIILIVLCAIIVFWLLGSLLKALRSGCEGIYGFFCWPCSMRSNRAPVNAQPQYVQPQYVQQPNYYQQPQQPAYTQNRNDYNRVFEDDYQMESTQDFDLEEQKRKSLKKKQATENENNDNQSWLNYNPFSSDNHKSKY